MAVQKFATLNPSTNLSANKIITALMTSKNRPRVIMVIGNVRMTKIGLTNKFKIDNTTDTIIAPT